MVRNAPIAAADETTQMNPSQRDSMVTKKEGRERVDHEDRGRDVGQTTVAGCNAAAPPNQ
jgi:hypothetical protein